MFIHLFIYVLVDLFSCCIPLRYVCIHNQMDGADRMRRDWTGRDGTTGRDGWDGTDGTDGRDGLCRLELSARTIYQVIYSFSLYLSILWFTQWFIYSCTDIWIDWLLKQIIYLYLMLFIFYSHIKCFGACALNCCLFPDMYPCLFDIS